MKTYPVLKPIYSRVSNTPTAFAVEWEQIGTATSLQEAKDEFGGAPVLGATITQRGEQ